MRGRDYITPSTNRPEWGVAAYLAVGPASDADRNGDLAATLRQVVIADRLLTASVICASESPLSAPARRFLNDILDSSVPRGADHAQAVSLPPASRPVPSTAGRPALPSVTVCVGVRVDGVIVHAPGCTLPCATTWPNVTHGLSDACRDLTARTWGLA